ncbi:hypothetical protein, partial [Paenibacillus aestuarii]
MRGGTKSSLQAVKIGLRSRTARAVPLQLGRIGLRRGGVQAATSAAVVRKSQLERGQRRLSQPQSDFAELQRAFCARRHQTA